MPPNQEKIAMTMDNLAQAKDFLRQADALTDQAHALLDPIARVAIDSNSAIEIRRVADLMPPASTGQSCG